MTAKGLMVMWLNDAYAMENAIVEILEQQADGTADHPVIQSRIQQHLAATRQHAETVRTCLAQLDEGPSAVTKVLGEMGGIVHGAIISVNKDNLVRVVVNDYAAEQMEIASYQALIVAAQELGQTGIADVCRRILQDEEEMAAWLDEQLPVVVRETVNRLVGKT